MSAKVINISTKRPFESVAPDIALLDVKAFMFCECQPEEALRGFAPVVIVDIVGPLLIALVCIHCAKETLVDGRFIDT